LSQGGLPRLESAPCAIDQIGVNRLRRNNPDVALLAVSSSREDRSKPLRDGSLEVTQLPMIESGHLTVRDTQVAVVVNQDMR
jgi:hypothetical protein